MSKVAPSLDTEWIRLVEPTLPPRRDVSDVKEGRRRMAGLDATKVHMLNIEMPDLKNGLEITNIRIPMRDGEERELRVFKPKDAKYPLPIFLR
jgi:predicted acyl esterase